MLFILVVEVLAISIRSNPRIMGIEIGQKQWKISQYADDTCLFLADEQSMSLVFLVIDKFTKCSGLKMNRDKSEAMHIGASSYFRHKNHGLKWTHGPIRYLGIMVENDSEHTSLTNINIKLDKIQSIIDNWKHRSLSLKGKVTIINSLLISQMLYIASVLYIPQWAIRKFNKLIIDFLWDGKPPKIKYPTIIAEVGDGGLKLQDLETKIQANKVMWIQRILDQVTLTPWKAYLQTKYRQAIHSMPLYNLDYNDITPIKEPFYNDMWKTYTKIHFNNPSQGEEVAKLYIWNNSLIKIEGSQCGIQNGKKQA
jgi:hypothetical protein